MIRFKRLKAENFLILKEVEIHLDTPGIFQIKGLNLDRVDGSNGAGKSSIIEALLWGLYGRTVRGYSADEVVNVRANHNCLVQIDFSIEDVEYRIIRYRKHELYNNRTRLFRNDEEQSQETLKDNQAAIERIVGIDFQAFINYIVFGQGESRKILRFSEMTDLQRKETLEALLPTSWMPEVQEKISKELSSVNNELFTLMDKFNTALLSHKSFDKLDKFAPKVDEINVEKVKKDIKSDLDKIDSLKEKKRELEIKYKTSIKKESSEKSVIIHSIDEKKNKIVFFKQNPACPECGSKLSLDYRKEKVDFLKEEKTSLQKQLEGLKDPLSDFLEIEINTIDTEISETEISKNRKSTSLSLYERLKQEQLRHAEQIKEMEKKSKESETELNRLRSKIEFLKEKVKPLEFWKHAFSTKGIRSIILDSVTEYLSDKANEYVQFLSMGNISLGFSTHRENKSKVSEKFEINVTNTAGTPSYSGNSGGERQLIDLAVLFAVRDVASLYSKIDCNIIFLDEIFKHLDSIGIESVKNLLDQLRKRIDTIFVVTHLDMGDVFDGAIIVKRENNLSKVIQEDS